MTSVGENIKNIRKKNNITQEELAEKLNVTRQAVSNWENGKSEPDIETLTKIAQIFDISIDELVDGKPKNILKNIPKNKLTISIIFIAFSVISFIAFEIISPIMKDYVYKYYDYRYYYLIVGIWKPIAIILGTYGIFEIIFNVIDLKFEYKKLKKIFLIISLLLLTVVFISNILACVLMFYVHITGNSINTYALSPAFFMMQHQILYTVPAILLTLGIYKKHE